MLRRALCGGYSPSVWVLWSPSLTPILGCTRRPRELLPNLPIWVMFWLPALAFIHNLSCHPTRPTLVGCFIAVKNNSLPNNHFAKIPSTKPSISIERPCGQRIEFQGVAFHILGKHIALSEYRSRHHPSPPGYLVNPR
jgi:hypothetical protein